MLAPDTQTWRRPSDAELRIWTGHGAPGQEAWSVVRILNRLGHTVAMGQMVAFDPEEGVAALLGPLHRPGAAVWTSPADVDTIWVLDE
jgi:hypothetical protein